MHKFSDLNISPDVKTFIGEKVKISKILNQEITVRAFRIEESKFPKNKSGMCLSLQIMFEDQHRVLFTGSDVLISQIKKVPEGSFPFTTTIKKEGECFMFS